MRQFTLIVVLFTVSGFAQTLDHPPPPPPPILKVDVSLDSIFENKNWD